MNPTRLALVIALVALVAPTLRYAVSFQAAEPALSVFGLRLEISAVTGLAIALSYEGAAFLGLHEAMKAQERGRKHWWWPAAGAGVQVAVGAGIIVPVLVAELRETPLAVVLGPVAVWTWSAAVVVATPLSLATLALSLAVQPVERKPRPQKPKPAICSVCGAEEGPLGVKDWVCDSCTKSARGETHHLPLGLSLEVLSRDAWVCYYCGRELRHVPAGERHIDHFIPKSKGGEDIVENLVTSCASCNLSKNDRMPSESEIFDFDCYRKAKSAGSDKKSQILALAGGDTPVKQSDIARILRTSQGYVSSVIRASRSEENTSPNIEGDTQLEARTAAHKED